MDEYYTNTHTKLKMKCAYNHEIEISFNNFLKNKRCKKCADEKLRKDRQRPVDEIYSYIKKYDFSFIKWVDEYQNCKSKFIIKCNNNHIICTNYNNFKKSKNKCKDCARQQGIFTTKKLDGEFVYNEFIRYGYIPLFNYEDYKSTDQSLPFICPNHKNNGIQYISLDSIRRNYECKYCSLEKRSGRNHYCWKGGFSPFAEYLRNQIKPWINDSFKYYNYKCIFTGLNNKHLIIHHSSNNFSNIVKETFKQLNMKIKSKLSDYTDNEKQEISSLCLKLHYQYGFGVCMIDSLHILFHKLYGKTHNTSQQLDEFKIRLKSGEFNDFLKENNLKLII